MDRRKPDGVGRRNRLKKWIQRLPLLPLCAAGFLCGILCCLFMGQADGALAPERLRRMREEMPDPKALLPCVCWSRGKWIMGLGILATTYLAPAACCGAAAWMGWSLGAFSCVALSNYGIKGLLLIFAGIFPQWLFYAPGFYFWMEWCMELYRGISHRCALHKKNCLIRMLLCLLFLGIGIFTECFWNPVVLHGILSRF